MKTLNNELYNYYDEQVCYLNRQLQLFELCEMPNCPQIIERIIQYSKARDRAFEGLYIDNNFKAPLVSL